MANNPSEYIFLSYSRKDSNVLQDLKHLLAKSGIKYWTDENIEIGTPNWRRALDKAIRESNGIIVLLSPDSSTSQWVLEEIALAEVVEKPILPLLIKGELSDAIPFGLILAQHIDMRFDWEAGSRKLLAFLRKNIFANLASEQKIKSADDDTIVFPDTSVLVFTQEPTVSKIWSIVNKHLTEPEWHDPIVQAIRASKYTGDLLERLLKAEQNSKLKHFPLLLAVSTLSDVNRVDTNLRKKIIVDAFNLIPSLLWQSPFLWNYSNETRNVTGYDIWYQLAQIPRDEFLQKKFSDTLQDKKSIPEMRIGAATILENFVALEGFALAKWGDSILYNFSAVTALFLKGEIERLKRIINTESLNHELGLRTAKYLIMAKERDFAEAYLFKVLKQLSSTNYTELFLIKDLSRDLESKGGFLNIATNKIFNSVEREDAIDTLAKLGYIDEAANLYYELAMAKGASLYNPYIRKLGELNQVVLLEKIINTAKGKHSLKQEGEAFLDFPSQMNEFMGEFFEIMFDDKNYTNAALSAVSELSKIGAMEKLKELSNDEEIHWMVKERIISELEKGNKNGQ